ncbi:OPT oligopeptide transporter protein-domain-containing protein [Polychytrium aggregatum]|uniref:OPT oligopeptide transporter protein-domain-containing protein n=1 Tax=Polychytrium aggregatum TaxID=110093 RepID=UPI0022FDDCCF|nr:OPT oligopeptide transporter protein-domain-containing protein [Polychytrium aggregatum]KAI9202784.1 OPT oligopeptide transporter protein-domain-containing protein [Polychytrium aggregatum]
MAETTHKEHHHATPKLDTEEKEVLGITTIDSDDVEHLDAHGAYAQISAIVSTTDDPSIPCFTVRALFLAIFFCVFTSAVNVILSFRTNQFTIPAYVPVTRHLALTSPPHVPTLQIIAYPIGIFFSKVLPDVRFKLFGVENSLNPGPFSIKEHVLIYIMSNSNTPYGIDNVVGQIGAKYLNDTSIQIWQSMLWILATQCLGLGLAGMARDFLIKPPAMYWPGNMGILALFASFHDAKAVAADSTSKYKMSRFKFFWIAFAIVTVWSFFPSFIAPAVTSISILCFFGAGANSLTNIFGSATKGVGLITLTLDWSQFNGYIQPLTTPFWANCVLLIGYVIWSWIIVPIAYVNNQWDAKFIGCKHPGPNGCGYLNGNGLFNGSALGQTLSGHILLNPATFELDVNKYNSAAPVHLGMTFIFVYASSFITIASSITHVALWYGKDIVQQARVAVKQLKEDADHQDIHNKLMAAYPEVSNWVYLGIFLFSTALMFVVGLATPYKLQWWGIILAIVMGIIFIIPLTTITALSGQYIGLNVLTEFIIGLIIPGDMVPVMSFKSLGYNVMIQAQTLLNDLKIGHYMKVPPQAMVAGQVIGAILSALICVPVATSFTLSPLFGIGNWQAAGYNTFYSAGTIWGAIAPARFFGYGALYHDILYAFPVGFLLPVLPWLGNKIYKHPYWHLVNIPIMANWVGPQYGNMNAVIVTFILSFVFQFYLFRYKNEWWRKYNFVLSAALDSGVAITAVIIGVLQLLFLQTDADGNPVGGFLMPTWFLNPNGPADFYCFDMDYMGNPLSK